MGLRGNNENARTRTSTMGNKMSRVSRRKATNGTRSDGESEGVVSAETN